MKILAIDTATAVSGIALVEGAVLRAEYSLNLDTTHNRVLLPAIERILADCGWSLEELDGFGVSLGPGSFTGLRFGLSVMKGLAWATGKPLAGIPTLEALAANVVPVPYPICPILDARKGEVYTAIYRQDERGELERLTPFMAVKPEKLQLLISEKTILVGDGLRRYQALLARSLGGYLLPAPEHLNLVRAATVAWLAWRRIRQGLVEDICTCTPLYVRASEAELSRSRA